MTDQEAKLLLDKYEEGLCNAEEKALIESWYLNLSAEAPQMTDGEPDYTYWNAYIKNNLPVKRSGAFKLWPKIGAAAAVVAITCGIWLYYASYLSTRHPKFGSGSPFANDIAPGKNTATLTLANGKTIHLSDAKTGVIVNPANLRYNDGSAVAQEDPSLRQDKGMMEQLIASTPRGGTYQFTLPDGSKVWLNAASSIKFPSTFGKSPMREVELSGEAYFEIFKNKKQPFVVKSRKMELTVLGTHFNVMAYGDELNVKTTLLEGSVSVSPVTLSSSKSRGVLRHAQHDIVLKPNQQSILTDNDKIKVVEVDAAEAVAWKNNKFIFDSQRIEEIMRMVARWYNVEVIYTAEVPKETFWGSVSRFDNISKVLKKLESTEKVHFKIEGRKVYVLP